MSKLGGKTAERWGGIWAVAAAAGAGGGLVTLLVLAATAARGGYTLEA